MSLLALEHVGKRYGHGRREVVALDDVTLAVQPGELVAVWGLARSGRTTLLRVAAGLERPDRGTVRFEGRPLVAGADGVAEGIGFVQTELAAGGGAAVADHVAIPLIARGTPPDAARARALLQLERVGVAGCAGLPPEELTWTERLRVAIAQALVTAPRLLLVDDPTCHVDLLERAAVLLLVRSIADGDVAVLMTTGEALGVAGVDRALTISGGVLRAEAIAPRAQVVGLHDRRPRPGRRGDGARP